MAQGKFVEGIAANLLTESVVLIALLISVFSIVYTMQCIGPFMCWISCAGVDTLSLIVTQISGYKHTIFNHRLELNLFQYVDISGFKPKLSPVNWIDQAMTTNSINSRHLHPF